MAEPSKARNFFGRIVDRILPGTNYNTQTGQYSNVGAGLGGLAARLITTAYAGPAAGALVNKAAGYLIDRNGNAIGPVDREAVGGAGGVSVGPIPGSVTLPSVSNLGLGAQSPGGTWSGYMQGAGSVNNFGNQNFQSGIGPLTNWSPTSGWGQSIISGAPSQGSLQGFGNNVGNFISGNSGAAISASRTGGNGGPVSSLGMDARAALLGPRSSLGIEKGFVKK